MSYEKSYYKRFTRSLAVYELPLPNNWNSQSVNYWVSCSLCSRWL